MPFGNVLSQVSLERNDVIDALTLIQNEWDYFEFEIRMLKSQVEDAKFIIKHKDIEIQSLIRIKDQYKEYTDTIKSKWWQSPFFDVIFFVGGFVLGVFAIGGGIG